MPKFQLPRLWATAMPPVVESPAPYDDVGNMRKSLPICPAASDLAGEILYCPVGRFAPTVKTTASVPSVRLARTCVSVIPEIELTLAPFDETSEVANAVATSMFSRELIGTAAMNGTVNCVTVFAVAPEPILNDTYCGIAAAAASPRPCAPAPTGAARSRAVMSFEETCLMVTASG